MKLRCLIALAVALMMGCTDTCLAQGQISRPGKQTTAPAKTSKPKQKPQTNKTSTPANKPVSQPKPQKAPAAVKVPYSSPNGYINNHGYVNLGLPSGTKWATCNIGSSTPEQIGNYYAWGETSPKSTYTGANSLYALKRPSGLLQNNKDLAPSHDAAHVNWGGAWRMPTRTEIDELVKNCQWQWIESPSGMLVTGPNGNSIFLPASGAKDGNSPVRRDMGCLWGSTVDDPVSDTNASELYFGKSSQWGCGASRYYGFNIRPVCR